jgi:hypothetical protein
MSAPWTAGLAASGLLLLAACTPLSVAPGTSVAQVRERFGAPSAEYTLPGQPQGSRLEYDTWPSGQRIYMIDFGPDGRAVQARQTLTADHFAEIQKGVDTTESVRRDFGKPRSIRPSFHLSHGYTVWEYPYREAEEWNSLVSITFDPKGVVRAVESGQDPALIVNR